MFVVLPKEFSLCVMGSSELAAAAAAAAARNARPAGFRDSDL